MHISFGKIQKLFSFIKTQELNTKSAKSALAKSKYLSLFINSRLVFIKIHQK